MEVMSAFWYTESEHAKIIQPEETEHEEESGQPCIG